MMNCNVKKSVKGLAVEKVEFSYTLDPSKYAAILAWNLPHYLKMRS